jgi:hypothetical protein
VGCQQQRQQQQQQQQQQWHQHLVWSACWEASRQQLGHRRGTTGPLTDHLTQRGWQRH